MDLVTIVEYCCVIDCKDCKPVTSLKPCSGRLCLSTLSIIVVVANFIVALNLHMASTPQYQTPISSLWLIQTVVIDFVVAVVVKASAD